MSKPHRLTHGFRKEKRILVHAGGQSRRLPAYAASGKTSIPIPVFRWIRGQRIDQTLLDLQLPLYERIMHQAPDSLHTLIVSGDVFIRSTRPLQPIPEADVVCYGLWVDPSLAKNHGVFFMNRHTSRPARLRAAKTIHRTVGGIVADPSCPNGHRHLAIE